MELFTANFPCLAEMFSAGAAFPLLSVMAQEAAVEGPSVTDVLLTANNIWMMVAAALVFIMHLGFAGVEAGFTQAKNTVNILFKNTLTPVLGVVTYALIGFALMYPGDFNGFFGFNVDSWNTIWFSPGNADITAGYADGGYTFWTDFFFQAMFAATCATIVSGAVAERIKLSAYLTFTLCFVSFVYPLIGSWKWGGGFLDELGFVDFAGSTLVHSVGGWGALIGIWLLGPRIGKYENGKTSEIAGSSVPLATIGVFLLWLGWFGFNGGSVLSADPGLVSLVLTTTVLGACGGAIGGHFTSMIAMKRIDFGMVLNGVLAGLVGITASADIITPLEALIIGGIAGILVVFSVMLLDKLKLDDCVGAVSVHLTCGIWGTLATGIFGEGASFMPQLYGVLACGAAASIGAFIIFSIIKATIGLRVSPEMEKHGLDSEEHGIRGYTILMED
ncbi:ammonium transporter, Amt family [Parapedobacter composti]|uniref:Ammonium transporter n=1 Tax=Parapedobacter composti TaxID=623281 RepID=A0A1I1JLP8_9SPHI|nr:ammonium transporter [Parapedobacter composti]SFC49507.1 ammonium transporter, Amt family [Parapedobacter composti]